LFVIKSWQTSEQMHIAVTIATGH